MFVKQGDNSKSVEITGGIKFTSLITDGLVANGRRAEYSSKYTFLLDTQQNFEWSTKIPNSWAEDGEWCVIAQVHSSSSSGSPNFAVELLNDRMLIKVRDKTGKSNYIYDEPMIKGVWTDFLVESRWTILNNGYIRVLINGKKVAEYSGSTIYEDAVTGGYFKCGIYMATKSTTVKRVIWHRV